MLKPVLLSGPVLKFIPALTNIVGGDLHAILFHQLSYLSRETVVGDECIKAKRISLTRLQRQLPFVSRRWLIQVMNDLENLGFVEVGRAGRVNLYIPQCSPDDLLKDAVQSLPAELCGGYIVIPALAQKIGLKNAIVLQQIHLRNHQQEGSSFFIRSLEQWHSNTFPFWGIATVKRIFSKLRDLNLTIVKPYRREDDGFVNSYRINYVGVAEILELPVPLVENPFDPTPKDSWNKDWLNWTNPVTLKKQGELQ